MNVLLKVGSETRNLGPRGRLEALFETIACRLEPDGRATRYPTVSFDLRHGRLAARRAQAAIRELDEIRTGLNAIPATKVLWPGSAPRWDGAASAYQALSAPDGRPLVEHLRFGAEHCASTGSVVEIASPEGVRKDRWVSVCVILGGAAWSLFAFLLIPRLLISPLGTSDEHPSGIPVWRFGLLISAFGLWTLAATVLPGLRMWFLRRNWATITAAVAIMAIWMWSSIVN